MSSNNQTKLPIDFSTLKFSAPVLDKDSDSEEEQDPDYVDEHAFTKEYTFTVADPNPPPAPVDDDEEAGDPHEPSDLWRLAGLSRLKYTPPPEPLVKIVVRTIDRNLIPPGEFYLYMDEHSEDFLQFSMSIFNKNGRIKPSLYQIKSEKGTGVWGREVNKGTIAYIEEIRVHPKYQRQGLGRWAIENLLKCDILAHCPFFFLWSTVLNDRSFFEGPDPHFESKKQGATAFWRSVGFRRVGGTWFFGYARDPNHPMRSLRMEDDAGETQSKDYTPLDAHDASFLVING